MFPAEYNGSLFVPEHGSWNRGFQIGYRLVNVKLDADNAVTDHQIFASGWLQNQNTTRQSVWGKICPVFFLTHLQDQILCPYCGSWLKLPSVLKSLGSNENLDLENCLMLVALQLYEVKLSSTMQELCSSDSVLKRIVGCFQQSFTLTYDFQSPSSKTCCHDRS